MKTRYRNVSFLVELLINVMVFSVSCAVLVGLFGKAGQLFRSTKEQAGATNEINTLVQTVKAQGAGSFYTETEENIFYYDDTWSPARKEDSLYQIEFNIEPQAHAGGTLYQIVAVARDAQGQEICLIETADYVPVGGDG